MPADLLTMAAKHFFALGARVYCVRLAAFSGWKTLKLNTQKHKRREKTAVPSGWDGAANDSAPCQRAPNSNFSATGTQTYDVAEQPVTVT